MKKSNMHTVESREADRQYYDTHDITQEPGEEVEITVADPLGTIVSIKLDEGYADKLFALADAQGERNFVRLARRLLHEAIDRAMASKTSPATAALHETAPGGPKKGRK